MVLIGTAFRRPLDAGLDAGKALSLRGTKQSRCRRTQTWIATALRASQ
jgi:hypothetical protein